MLYGVTEELDREGAIALALLFCVADAHGVDVSTSGKRKAAMNWLSDHTKHSFKSINTNLSHHPTRIGKLISMVLRKPEPRHRFLAEMLPDAIWSGTLARLKAMLL